jgi:chromosome segregation ATPase
MSVFDRYDEIKLVETPRTPSQEDVEYRKRVDEQMRRKYPTIPELELALEIERGRVAALTDEIEPTRAEVAKAREVEREARNLAREAEKIAAIIRSTFMQFENAFKQAERERNTSLRDISQLERELDDVKKSREPFYVPGEGLVFANQKKTYTIEEEQRELRERLDVEWGTQERLAEARERAKHVEQLGQLQQLKAKVDSLKTINAIGAKWVEQGQKDVANGSL